MTPGLDPGALERLQETGGSELVERVVGLFLERAPELLQEAERGVLRGDHEEVRRALHALSGSAGMLGAGELRQRARALALQPDEGRLAALREEFVRVERWLRQRSNL